MSAYSPPSLSFHDGHFTLSRHEGKFRIFSGAIHYFRVVPEYWRDRLQKAKACGLNTVETYVPWNLHEPKPGCFKNEGMLDLQGFIKMAAELGLYVIFRPGPYICSEWDFGGLPSWLLADPDMKVRSNYPGYQEAVKRFFSWLLPQVVDLQYSRGGPIIAVQIENEFGSYSEDPEHLHFIRQCLIDGCITTELFVTSDNESACATAPTLQGVLPTANGQTVEEVDASFQMIRRKNPAYPLMVMELWSGWFDHWGGEHETRSVELLEKTIKFAFENNASINLYMFHGGTNFGFMAGAIEISSYKADITSYDYDAPLSEDGFVTEKFLKVQKMIKAEKDKMGWENDAPELKNRNGNRAKEAKVIAMDEMMSWDNILKTVKKKTSSDNPQFMETYTYEGDDIQSYGYIVYRKQLQSCHSGSPEDKNIVSFSGRFRDRLTVLANGHSIAKLNYDQQDESVGIPSPKDTKVAEENAQVFDLVVENLARVNYSPREIPDVFNSQRKGLTGPVKLDKKELKQWDVFALDFCETFLDDLSKSSRWAKVSDDAGGCKGHAQGPVLFKGNLHIAEEPIGDYFVRMIGSGQWQKGLVIVNGFNLGRYWSKGPSKTLYLPAPLLKPGDNQVIVFEEENGTISEKEILFECEPCLQ